LDLERLVYGVYDSFGSSQSFEMGKNLLEEIFTGIIPEFPSPMWKFVKHSIPHQTDNFSCGVLAVFFLECLLHQCHPQLPEGEQHVMLSFLRFRMLYLLLNSV
jgi:Ulp1 family protease